jgi:predicted membrane channel-forming protein YqfA (hemolysin III family)
MSTPRRSLAPLFWGTITGAGAGLGVMFLTRAIASRFLGAEQPLEFGTIFVQLVIFGGIGFAIGGLVYLFDRPKTVPPLEDDPARFLDEEDEPKSDAEVKG